jgi:hypothetical protein
MVTPHLLYFFTGFKKQVTDAHGCKAQYEHSYQPDGEIHLKPPPDSIESLYILSRNGIRTWKSERKGASHAFTTFHAN